MRRQARRLATTALLLITSLASLSLWATSAAADLKPRISKFCFDNATKEITFFAYAGGKEDFSFVITSSSGQTVFQPATTSGNFSGVVGGGNTWTVTPGGAGAGEIHTFTITCTNSNGSSNKALDLTVVASAPQDAPQGAASYGEASVCAIPDVPATSPAGLALAALLLGAIGLFAQRSRRGREMATKLG